MRDDTERTSTRTQSRSSSRSGRPIRRQRLPTVWKCATMNRLPLARVCLAVVVEIMMTTVAVWDATHVPEECHRNVKLRLETASKTKTSNGALVIALNIISELGFGSEAMLEGGDQMRLDDYRRIVYCNSLMIRMETEIHERHDAEFQASLSADHRQDRHTNNVKYASPSSWNASDLHDLVNPGIDETCTRAHRAWGGRLAGNAYSHGEQPCRHSIDELHRRPRCTPDPIRHLCTVQYEDCQRGPRRHRHQRWGRRGRGQCFRSEKHHIGPPRHLVAATSVSTSSFTITVTIK